jgi:4-hydroxy-2-oxoheptanedioate aldolase
MPMASFTALADRLKEGAPAITAWCGIPEPWVAGILARETYDAVTLDMQHGSYEVANVIRAIPLILGAGKPAMARIPVGEFQTASKLLDAGASGIIAPMINTVEDARRFVSFMKFPPVGERSWGPLASMILSGIQPAEYLKGANTACFSFAMIETREALANIDEILAVPGLDAIFMGPSDLSITLSRGVALNLTGPDVEKALDHALARARAAGKIAGAYAPTGERAAEFAKRGFSFIALGSDTVSLRMGAQAALKAAGR